MYYEYTIQLVGMEWKPPRVQLLLQVSAVLESLDVKSYYLRLLALHRRSSGVESQEQYLYHGSRCYYCTCQSRAVTHSE